MPFCGVPLLDLAVSRLAGLGLSRIVVNACHLGEAVAARVAESAERLPGVEVFVSREATLLDTGGGLRQGLTLVPDAEHVLVHNADVLLDFDVGAMLDAHLASGALATVALVPGRGPRTVEMAGDGLVRAFRRPRGTAPYTFAGVHVFAREALSFLPPRPACSIIEAYEAALAAGRAVRGVSVGDAYWSDLGTWRDYIEAHGSASRAAFRGHALLRRAFRTQARRREQWMARGCQITGAVGLGRRLRLVPGVHLYDTVLWDGTRVDDAGLLAAGMVTGGRVRPLVPVLPERRPDPRIYATLGAAPEAVSMEPLARQGSGRGYSRLRCGERSWIWSVYSQDRAENAGFAACAGFLKRLGLSVPDVLVHLPDKGELLLGDLGSTPLLKIGRASCRERV